MTIRVVLADDHGMLRDGLLLVLSREADIDVVGVAADGPSALALTREHVPDVLMLDIAMPGMCGLDVAQCLREELPGTRILVLSGYVDKRYVQGALKAGASGYVAKAAAAKELPGAIRAVVAGQKYLSPEITAAVVDQAAPVVSALTARESDVLRLVAEGKRSAAIARRLGITEGTVEVHRHNLMRKLDLHNVAELTRYAVREGLIAL